MNIFSGALTLFVVTNPIGNIPVLIALLKDFNTAHQRRILVREGVIAFVLAAAFLFVGESFLGLLKIERYSVSLCGGFLLFIVALQMIFPHHQSQVESLKKEPLVVPIATPLLTGGCVMTTILVLAKDFGSPIPALGALCLCQTVVLAVLLVAPYLHQLLGKRGLIALEQLMGMVLTMLAIEMINSGISLFLKTL